MGSLTANPYDSYGPLNQYSPYDSGGRIFALDPSEPERSIHRDPDLPPAPPLGLIGLLLGLGYWATRQSSAPTAQPPFGAPIAPSTDRNNQIPLENQRRVSDQTDEINGGPGRPTQDDSATRNRASQLAGLSDGSLTFGQQTPFPPTASVYNSGLPAVLRGVNMGQTDAGAPSQAPMNKGAVGWQSFASPPSLFDDLEIPYFLRRNKQVEGDSGVRLEKQGLEPGGPSLGGGGGQGRGGGNGNGNGNERKDDGRNECLERWLDEYYEYCDQFRPWGTRYRDACRSRAENRLRLCYSNNHTPDPQEPPRYNFNDIPRNPRPRRR
jgi:hypothetical protein